MAEWVDPKRHSLDLIVEGGRSDSVTTGYSNNGMDYFVKLHILLSLEMVIWMLQWGKIQYCIRLGDLLCPLQFWDFVKTKSPVWFPLPCCSHMYQMPNFMVPFPSFPSKVPVRLCEGIYICPGLTPDLLYQNSSMGGLWSVGCESIFPKVLCDSQV